VTRSPRLARALLGGLILAAIIVGAGSFPASADGSVPYQDPNAAGYIGLCNKDEQPVTSGSVYDQPFVWTAVSSVAAPSGYDRGMAVLLAFQPVQALQPMYWSGDQLTGSSSFTNPAHPMAQATYADEPLIAFIGGYPPKWDGLIQLRMYYGGANLPNHQEPYAATNIRITGSNWAVVDGGTASCDAGSATSIETTVLPKSALKSPKPVKADGGQPTGATTAASPGPADTSNGDEGIVAQGSGGSGGGSGLAGAGLAAVAVIGAAVGLFYIWRRSAQRSR